MTEIWAYSEKPSLLAELIGGAHLLAEKVNGTVAAVVLGQKDLAEKAAALGAAKVFWLGEKNENNLVEDYIPTIGQLLKTNKPTLLLIGATQRGKAAAGRLAAQLHTSAVTDVKDIVVDGNNLLFQHMIFGGGAVRMEQAKTEVTIATVGSGIFQTPEKSTAPGKIVDVPFVEPAWKIKFVEKREKKSSAVNLAAAKRVVCPGRGVSKREDLVLIDELAHLLEAEIGCTRPLAEGLDWYPRERYIGVSGATIKPELYFGVGVSGQVQHMIGATDSQIIVAVNKDKNAAIFRQADYGVIGDLYTFLPALISALKARK